MDLMEGIYSRRSIRSFTEELVSKEMIDKLLEAATLAPSASNGQPWAFAVVEGSQIIKGYSDRSKAHLLEVMGDEDPRGYKKALSNPGFNIFYDAGTLIIIYSKHKGGFGDCCLAAQNLMLAAHAAGMGTCWIGLSTDFFDTEEFKSEMGIPLEYKAVAPLAVGYPGESRSGYLRKPPEIVVWKK